MKKLVSIFLLALTVLTGCAPSLEEEKPAPLTEKELLETDGEYLDAAGKVIALKEILSVEDRLFLYSEIDEIKNLLGKEVTCAPLEHKLKGGK